MNKKQLEIFLHCAVIIGGLALLNFPGFDLRIGVFRTGDGSFVVPSVVGTLINCMIFYGNSEALIPRFLSTNRRTKYIVLLCTLFIGLSAVEAVIDYGLVSFAKNQEANNQSVVGEIISTVVVFNALILLASFAYKFSKDWLQNERLKRVMAEEKLSTELAFLKSQINPHFLFNTLNNLFSMALQSNDQRTAEGISQLASLMRYMLYESNSNEIYLEKELDYIRNYIGLQELRLSGQDNITICYTVHGDPNAVQLAPILFIPFIENAFKYGISMNTASTIEITFEIQATSVHCTIINTINQLSRQAHNNDASGVGLKNVQRRLELLYPNKHDLRITDDGTTFDVRLQLTHLDQSSLRPMV